MDGRSTNAAEIRPAPAALEARDVHARYVGQQIARSVAVVSQSHEVAFGFAVREVVMMGRAPHQGTAWMHAREEDQRIVDDVLARCDLAELAARPVQELSGGEQKRVAIARALA